MPLLGGVGKRIVNHDFFWLSLAVYTGGVLERFLRSLIADILLPLSDALLGLPENSTIRTRTVTVLGKPIFLGDFLANLGSVAMAIGLVVGAYYFVRGL